MTSLANRHFILQISHAKTFKIKYTKGFVFYGVTFDLCRFCTFLISAQLAGWAKFKNVQNLHKLNVTP